MNIGFIPIDNRPVCYTLPLQLGAIDENINIFMPNREWLGDLEKYADTEKIFVWLTTLPKMDAFIVSLDTIAYGGLISSRRSSSTFKQIKEKIEKFKSLIKTDK